MSDSTMSDTPQRVRAQSTVKPVPVNVLRAFWQRMSWRFRLYLLALFCLLLLALLAQVIAPFDPDAQSLLSRLRPPMGFDHALATHPLGTDELGRDVLSRTLYGLQFTLLIALVGSTLSLIVGVVCGVIAGFFAGRTGVLLVAAMDFQMAVPFTLVALLTVALLGSSLPVIVTVIGLSGWEVYARVVRAQVLIVCRQPFIEAARAAGASPLRILLRHVLPNVSSQIVVVWTMTFPALILLESSLSFLGLGVQPPTATLGSMVGFGRDYLASSPWIALVPSLVIMALSLLVLLVGEGLRDQMDVRLR
ncbi:ABC transporter permease [Serratia sp. Leaf50]|nr:ABC transporter permease [Serratia sp. Leaf50]